MLILKFCILHAWQSLHCFIAQVCVLCAPAVWVVYPLLLGSAVWDTRFSLSEGLGYCADTFCNVLPNIVNLCECLLTSNNLSVCPVFIGPSISHPIPLNCQCSPRMVYMWTTVLSEEAPSLSWHISELSWLSLSCVAIPKQVTSHPDGIFTTV